MVYSAPNPLDELTINVNVEGDIKGIVDEFNPLSMFQDYDFPTYTASADTNVYCGVKKKGIQYTSYIIGGKEAEVNEYPWMVRMLNKGDPWCGGSIIADKWILTAAHCMTHTEVEDLDVIIGEHDITTTTESQITTHVKPDLIILHPDYISVLHDFPDIALLRIPPIDLKMYTPICLPSQGDDYTGKNAWVYGWGLTQWNGDSSDVLLELEVPVWSDTEAKKAWWPAENITDEELAVSLFAGGEVGESSCRGDSGGPLSYSNPNNNGRHQQIGIVSAGSEPCDIKKPAFYTEVSALIPWIHEKIASNGGANFGTA